MVRNKREFRCTENDINDNNYWGELLNSKFPGTLDFREFQCYGVIKDGEPLVAWAYHSYLSRKNHNIVDQEASVSIASFQTDWKPLRTIRLILSLFFKDTCYNRLTAVTHSSNRQAVRLVKLAGFTLEGRIRKPTGTEDKLQFSILREDYKGGRFYG